MALLSVHDDGRNPGVRLRRRWHRQDDRQRSDEPRQDAAQVQEPGVERPAYRRRVRGGALDRRRARAVRRRDLERVRRPRDRRRPSSLLRLFLACGGAVATVRERARREHGLRARRQLSGRLEARRLWHDLYPTEDDWRVIHDLEVLDQLRKRGDDGHAERQIDHWVYFDDDKAAAPFVSAAEAAGFTHDAKHSHRAEDGTYCVRLNHFGPATIESVSRRTIALRRKAEEFGGKCDGWETPVVTGVGT